MTTQTRTPNYLGIGLAVAWRVATARTIASTRSGQIWRRRPAAAALDGRNLS